MAVVLKRTAYRRCGKSGSTKVAAPAKLARKQTRENVFTFDRRYRIHRQQKKKKKINIRGTKSPYTVHAPNNMLRIEYSSGAVVCQASYKIVRFPW